MSEDRKLTWDKELEARKNLLRKAAASLFRTWIPDHPEGSLERGQCYALLRDAMVDAPPTVTFVSLLSTGVEDIMAFDYLESGVSMQEILVQREGTDAFLDAKNALRVVRKKYGMMNLLGRMASIFEQRNLAAITLSREIEPDELLRFCRTMSTRVEGTQLEEQQGLRRALKKGQITHVDVLFHDEVVGRRLPVSWPVKASYTRALRAIRQGVQTSDAIEAEVAAAQRNYFVRELRGLALYGTELAAEFDRQDAPDLGALILREADETRLLNVTRALFDEFNALRAERSDHHTPIAGHDAVAAAAEDAFLADVVHQFHDDDEFLRLAQTLERLRSLRGREFFSRISMVSGDMSFVDAALTGGGEDIADQVAQLDPIEGLARARAITEPFYRARALSNLVAPLLRAGRTEDAPAAAREALSAARACAAVDFDEPTAGAVVALVAAGLPEEAADGLAEGLRRAHQRKEPEARAHSLIRLTSALIEAGPIPPVIRAAVSQEILSEDVHFWGRPEVTPALVELVLALVSADDEDIMIFLQKVVAHPHEEVRRSVIRAMPFGQPALRNMLLSHLRDREADVRIEVIHRIGFSGDPTLAIYLVNHLRQGHTETADEARAVAMNLARLDPDRYFDLFNALLGPLGVPNPQSKFKPFKEDPSLQLAAIEVLYFLNSRESRRAIFHASERARGAVRETCQRAWRVVKGLPYGEPTLPRSPHDLEWSQEDQLTLDARLDRQLPSEPEPAPEPVAVTASEAPQKPEYRAPLPRKSGLLSRLKRLFTSDEEEESTAGAPAAGLESTDAEDAGTAPGASEEPLMDEGPLPAALRFEAMLLEGPEAWTGALPMSFRLYDADDADEPIWQEAHASIQVAQGSFEILLGEVRRLPPSLPNVVWLGVAINGTAEMSPRARLSRARTIVQG